MPRSLRVLVVMVAVLTLAFAAVACGDDDEPSDSGSSSASSSASGEAADEPTAPPTDEPTVATEAAGFPVTIEHKFGSVTIESEPQRVVSVGFQEHDTILALGVKPLAVRDWWNDQPYATWVWAKAALGDAQPAVFGSGELDLEAVAGLEPDLIIGPYAGLTRDEYDVLSVLAPTVLQPAEYEDYTMPWREQTLLIGKALGKSEMAQAVIDEVESQFEAARGEHPEFQDASFVIAGSSGDGNYWLYGPNDPRSRILADLGFQMPEPLVTEVGDVFYATLSAEKASLLDTDVVIWFLEEGERDSLPDDSVFQQLSAVQQERVVFIEWSSDLAGAFSFSSVLSLPFLLDELAPQLTAALEKLP